MKTHRISRDYNRTFEIQSQGHTWIFTNQSTIAPEESWGIHEIGKNNRLELNGAILGAQDKPAVESEGQNVDILVGKSGIVSGDQGLYVLGKADIVNRGQILSSANDGSYIQSAFYSAGSGTEVHNFGLIESAFATSISGDKILVVNEKGGRIIGSEWALAIGTTEAWSSKSINYGLLKSDGYAFTEGRGADTLVNHGMIKGDIRLSLGDNHLNNIGTIKGNITLGLDDSVVTNSGVIDGNIVGRDGNETFDLRGGKLTGTVSGGLGDDILVTHKANCFLTELDGQGEDTIRSTVSYRLNAEWYVERLQLIGGKAIDATGTVRSEELTGNAGDNRLSGLKGTDRLDGKAGNDTLLGGAAGDFFHFNKGYDKDTIVDFEHGMDRIDIVDWTAISDFGDVLSHAKNHGNDVWIQVGKDILVIEGLAKADLETGDFGIY